MLLVSLVQLAPFWLQATSQLHSMYSSCGLCGQISRKIGYLDNTPPFFPICTHSLSSYPNYVNTTSLLFTLGPNQPDGVPSVVTP